MTVAALSSFQAGFVMAAVTVGLAGVFLGIVLAHVIEQWHTRSEQRRGDEMDDSLEALRRLG